MTRRLALLASISLLLAALAVLAPAAAAQTLVAHYPFAGNAQDVSGNGNHGTVLGAALAPGRNGVPNTAYAFDGVNDSIAVNYSTSLSFSGSVSVTAWVQTSDSFGQIVGQHQGGSSGNWVLGINSGRMKFGLSQNALGPQMDSVFIADGQWHYLVGVYDAGRQLVQHYVDGRKVFEKAESNTPRNQAMALRLGNENSGSWPLMGVIDEVRVYQGVLTGAGYETFGRGCPGSRGVPELVPVELPVIGEPFTLLFRSVPVSQPGLVFPLSASRKAWGSIPLPLDLQPFGMTGCQLHVSGEIPALSLPPTPLGALVWGLVLPNDSTLLGAEFHNQAFFVDPGANPAGLVATNAGRGVIGGKSGIVPFTTKYSKQETVQLDLGESYVFTLKSGARKRVRLKSVQEHKDTVVSLVRHADVVVEIGGLPHQLTCAPYTMPTVIDGLRIVVDTTSGWGNIGKRAQLSLWDATDPIVDTNLFRFPLRDYLVFSHGMQAYNEPVHLGMGDGDPGGGKFYHDYGFDLAGYEGRDPVICCAAGKVVRRNTPGHVAVEDDKGFVWEYHHMISIDPGVQNGQNVQLGQPIGTLGKTGGSGNFAHLHLGTYRSIGELNSGSSYRAMNLYPWLVAAYEAEKQKGLYAVARAHQLVLTGETVSFGASRSLAYGGRIVSHRWVFHDGTTQNGATAQKVYNSPGVYMVELWVTDDQGRQDVDFWKVKVFTLGGVQAHMPTIFMTHNPTEGVAVNQPVTFRCWLQASSTSPFKLDFGDGTVLPSYTSYSAVQHPFKTAGLHVVTATATFGGLPITQKVKVLVK